MTGVVLACDSTTCALVSEASVELVPMPVSGVHGVVAGGSGVCVYGDGLHCFVGSTSLERLPSAGPRFRAAASRDDAFWLAGDAGRLTRIAGDGAATEVASGVTASLRAIELPGPIDAGGIEAVAAGDAGTVVVVIAGAAIACNAGGSPIVGAAVPWWDHGAIAIVDQAGAASWTNGSFWCSASVASEPIVRGRAVHCGASTNLWWLTESTLFGDHACVVP